MATIPIEAHLGAARLAFFTPVRDQPPLADRKASVLLAANGLMVSVVFSFSRPIESILLGPQRLAAWLMIGVLIVGSLLILTGVGCAFIALTKPIPPMPDSPVLFKHIAERSLDEYRAEMLGLDYPRAVEAMLHYNYSLATLCIVKFRLVNRSMQCARSTFGLFMVLLLMIMAIR